MTSYAREALKRLDNLRAHYAHKRKLDEPFNELMRQWRSFLLRLPRSLKPRKLYMTDAELSIVKGHAERQWLDNAAWDDHMFDIICNIKASACKEFEDTVLFYLRGIPVYRRKK